MAKICYTSKTFSNDRMVTIIRANEILEEYAAQGYDLTLRQLYYQFVSRGFIANKDTEYKRLGDLVNDARMAGQIDWDHIVDRTRNLRKLNCWNSPQDIIDACAQQYRIDKWKSQPTYIEVWIEKDALIGVLEKACDPLEVPYFSCRGYTSQSEMWGAAQRLLTRARRGQKVVILHFGDHDPSGIDMTRDIEDRLTLFMRHHIGDKVLRNIPRLGGETKAEWVDRAAPLLANDPEWLTPVTINRIALTMEQIRQYDPPPNPAKLSDARAASYIEEYGDQSWELDALPPNDLAEAIQDAVHSYRDEIAWREGVEKEDREKASMSVVSSNWSEVVSFANGL